MNNFLIKIPEQLYLIIKSSIKCHVDFYYEFLDYALKIKDNDLYQCIWDDLENEIDFLRRTSQFGCDLTNLTERVTFFFFK